MKETAVQRWEEARRGLKERGRSVVENDLASPHPGMSPSYFRLPFPPRSLPVPFPFPSRSLLVPLLVPRTLFSRVAFTRRNEITKRGTATYRVLHSLQPRRWQPKKHPFQLFTSRIIHSPVDQPSLRRINGGPVIFSSNRGTATRVYEENHACLWRRLALRAIHPRQILQIFLSIKVLQCVRDTARSHLHDF